MLPPCFAKGYERLTGKSCFSNRSIGKRAFSGCNSVRFEAPKSVCASTIFFLYTTKEAAGQSPAASFVAISSHVYDPCVGGSSSRGRSYPRTNHKIPEGNPSACQYHYSGDNYRNPGESARRRILQTGAVWGAMVPVYETGCVVSSGAMVNSPLSEGSVVSSSTGTHHPAPSDSVNQQAKVCILLRRLDKDRQAVNFVRLKCRRRVIHDTPLLPVG